MFRKISITAVGLALALAALTSCVAIPLFEIDIIETNISNSGVFQGNTITFRATFDNGDSYAWDFGDGSTGSGQIVVHTYSSEGTFTVRLEITTGPRTLVGTKEIVIRLGAASGGGAPPGPVFPPRAFVYNNNDTLDVIDLDTKQILATIPLDEVVWFTRESMARFAVIPECHCRESTSHPRLACASRSPPKFLAGMTK